MNRILDLILKLIYKIIPQGVKTRFLQIIINDKFVWPMYDSLNIPGFGTNLARFIFPIYSFKEQNQIDSISESNKKIIVNYFSEHALSFEKYMPLISQRINTICNNYSFVEKDNTSPYINNVFIGVTDAAALQAMLIYHKPRNYIEIGSGISTKYAKAVITEEKLNTTIISIDPFPRSEIINVCDELITETFEKKFEYVLQKAQKGDIVFLDGSHYVFPSNDTVVFFFQIINNLPKGTIVHIHDIYLPFDYPKEAKKQLWAENYLLMAWILGGGNSILPLLPVNYLTNIDSTLRLKLEEKKILEDTYQKYQGFSFWFEIV